MLGLAESSDKLQHSLFAIGAGVGGAGGAGGAGGSGAVLVWRLGVGNNGLSERSLDKVEKS